jgi:predicted nucleic acid-binding protein
MILADTSVWIEFFNGGLGSGVKEDTMFQVVTCAPVIQEVFQGLRAVPQSRVFEERFLALPRLCDPLPLSLFVEAAEIYRQGRRKGFTIRSSIDCLIAAIAIHNRVTVWHRDRDFDMIAQYTALETFESIP